MIQFLHLNCCGQLLLKNKYINKFLKILHVHIREGQTNNSCSAVKPNSSVGWDLWGQGSKVWVCRGRERTIAPPKNIPVVQVTEKWGAAATRTLRAFW